METHLQEMMWNLLFLLLCHSSLVCSGLGVTKVTLDSSKVCSSNTADNIYWASKQKAILVIGRGASDRELFLDCSIIVGAAATESTLLQLHFEAFHIKDCGVMLAVNQSNRSDFTPDNSVMAKIGCNHGIIKVLHSQEKHFVKISVHKADRYLQEYNFRINITVTEKGLHRSDTDHQYPVSDTGFVALSDDALMSENVYNWEPMNMEAPVNHTHDKLPGTGPEMHVVVIVGLVMLFVVGVALWLLVKYLIRRTHRWHEHCAERNMERAIHLYNNQEMPPESDYMYTALPPQEAATATVSRRVTSTHRNGHCRQSKNAGPRSSRQRAGDITFVHVDGHIETFRMRDNAQERHSDSPELAPAAATPGTVARPAPSAGDGDSDSVVGDDQRGEDILGDCPPSYEEALNMPAPQNTLSPLYINLDSQADDNHLT